MPLVIEDGTVVANANSYVTLAEIQSWAEARGIVINNAAGTPATDEEIETAAVRAFDYIELLRDRYKGNTTTAGQRLSWPRDCVYYEGSLIALDSIPERLKQAQIQLTIYAAKGIELSPINEGRAGGSKFLIKQKMGPIEREYSEAAFLSANQMPDFFPVDKLLKPFMRAGYGQFDVMRA